MHVHITLVMSARNGSWRGEMVSEDINLPNERGPFSSPKIVLFLRLWKVLWSDRGHHRNMFRKWFCHTLCDVEKPINDFLKGSLRQIMALGQVLKLKGGCTNRGVDLKHGSIISELKISMSFPVFLWESPLFPYSFRFTQFRTKTHNNGYSRTKEELWNIELNTR